MEFSVGDISIGEWSRVTTKYPHIDVIIKKLHQDTGILDNKTIKDSINIYNIILYNQISPNKVVKDCKLFDYFYFKVR